MSRPLRTTPIPLAARILPVGLGLAILVAAGFTLVGAPVWIAVCLAALPWLIRAVRRGAGLNAIARVWFAGIFLLLVVLVVTAAGRLPMLLSVDVVISAAGLLGAGLLVVGPGTVPPRARGQVSRHLPAFLGAAFWLVISIGTAIIRPVSGLSWAMHGDAASYLLYARAVTRSSGIVIGPDENPVPLPSALLAVFMAPGRGGVPASNLLGHDIVAFESLQIAVIAVTCVMTGMLAGALARKSSPSLMVAMIASGAGSLLPLSWILTTNTLAYGYFDAELVLPIVFAAILLALDSERRAIPTAGLLAVASTVVLTVWSPLVVVTIGLLVTVLVTQRHAVLRARGLSRVFLVVSGAQLLVAVLAISLPSVLSQGSSLQASGSIYVFTHSLFPSIAVICVLLGALVLRVGRQRMGIVGVVVPISLSVGLGVLLFQNRASTNLWSYFPLKFEWLSVGVLVVVMLGLLPAVFLPWTARRASRFIASIAVASMAAVVCLSAPGSLTLDQVGVLPWLAQASDGPDGGASTAAVILDAGDPGRPVLYWQSHQRDERYVNYWMIELESRTMQNNALRKFAFQYHETGDRDLCTILGLVPGRVTLRTANPGLEASLMRDCPSASPRIAVSSIPVAP